MAVALSGERERLEVQDFPLPTPIAPATPLVRRSHRLRARSGMDYQRTLALIERSIIEQALQKTGGNKKAAADMLGLNGMLSAKGESFEPGTALN